MQIDMSRGAEVYLTRSIRLMATLQTGHFNIRVVR